MRNFRNLERNSHLSVALINSYQSEPTESIFDFLTQRRKIKISETYLGIWNRDAMEKRSRREDLEIRKNQRNSS